MTIYIAPITATSDKSANPASSGTYATVRNSTAATTTPGATAPIGQSFAAGAYSCTQYFVTFDTTTVATGQVVTLSLNVTSAGPVGDTLEVRVASASTNKIAGGSLATTTPLLGSALVPTATGRFGIQLDTALLPRSSAVILVVNSRKEQLNTAPAGGEAIVVSTMAAAAASRPQLAFEFLPIQSTSDRFVTATNAAYATARSSTAATSVTTGVAYIGQGNSAGTYDISQYFLTIDTTTIPAGIAVSLQLDIGSGAIAGDTVEVRVVSATTNKIDGASLAAQTPLLGSVACPTALGKISIPLDTAALPRSSAVMLLIASQKERLNTAVATNTDERFIISTVVGSAAADRPQLVFPTPKWQFVAAGTAAETSGLTLTLTEPAGVQSGDLMVACIAARANTVGSPIGTPTGWTLVARIGQANTSTNTSALADGGMFYIVRGASAPSLSFSLSFANVAQGAIVAYRGNALTSPLDANNAGQATATATTACSVTGYTTTQDDDLLVTMAAGGQEGGWSNFNNVTTPIGASGVSSVTTAPSATAWSERVDVNTVTGADTSLAIADAVRTITGATGNLQATCSASAGHVLIGAAFKIFTPPVADAWSNADKSANVTLSNSDKTAACSSLTSGVRSTTPHTMGTAGKYYFEFLAGSTVPVNLGLKSSTASISGTAETVRVAVSTGGLSNDSTSIGSIGSAIVANDVVCVAIDMGAELVWFRKNSGLWNNNGSANPATGASGLNISSQPNTDFCLWALFAGGDSASIRTELADYTQGIPSGFVSWMGETPATGNVTVNATGNALAISVGDETVTAVAPVSVNATTNLLTTTAGTVSAGAATIVNATTNLLTASVGDGTVSAKANVSATTNLATMATSTPTIVGKANVDATTNLLTLTGGDETTSGKASVSATTNLLTISVGTVSVTGKGNISALTNQAAISVGTVNVTTGGAALWTPAAIGADLIAWYDFADASTVTHAGGFLIQWRDKSVNARHANPMATTTMSVNSDGIYIANAASGSNLAIVMPTLPSAYFDFAFAGKPNAAGSYRTLMAQAAGSYHHVLLDTATNNLGTYSGAGGFFQAGSQTWPSVDGQIYFSAASSSTVKIGRDGVAPIDETGETFTPDATPYLMNYSVAGGQGFGTAREFVFMTAGMSQDIQDKVSGYLAWKWDGLLGITTHVTALPSGHPYKSAAPMTGAVNVTANATTNVLTSFVGDVTVVGKANVSATTNLATITAGTADAASAVNVSVNATTNLLTTTVGTVTVGASGNVTVNLSGQQIATSVGTVGTTFLGLTAGVTPGIVGSGGSLPTGWSIDGGYITVTVVAGPPFDDGVECFDLKIDASIPPPGDDPWFEIYYPVALPGQNAVAGNTWLAELYIGVVTSSGPPLQNHYLTVYGMDDSSGLWESYDNPAAFGPISPSFQSTYRSVDGTLINFDTTKVTGAFSSSLDALALSSYTFRIGAKLTRTVGGILTYPVGVQATTSVGTVTVTVTVKQNVSANATGNSLAITAGTATVAVHNSASAASQFALISTGNVTVTGKAVVTATTNLLTATAGTAITITGTFIIATGNQMTMTAGDASVTGKASTTIASVPGMTISVGDVTVRAGVSATVTAVPSLAIATALPGGVTVGGNTFVFATGNVLNMGSPGIVYVPSVSLPHQREGFMKTMANMMGN